MFKKMPMALLVSAILIGLCAPYLPIVVKSGLYALSLTIKSIILFVLPVIIFSLLFKVTLELSHKASKVFIGILLLICASNFFSTFISRGVSSLVYRFDLNVIPPQEGVELVPLWQFQLPTYLANDKAMFAAILLGLVLGYCVPRFAQTCSFRFNQLTQAFLPNLVRIVPFFILGFIVKLSHDGVLGLILQKYLVIFAIIAASLLCYISILYFVANRAKPHAFKNALANMLPAGFIGFSTMSSAAAMPLTILAAEKNTTHPTIARSVIPATVNVHLIGDCFAIPILAFAILKSFGLPEPVFMDYLMFSLFFVLAKFSVAAVPGGGILVMLPILESYLGFTPAMLSLITALYILFDPIITCANVMGNGGFAMIFDKLYSALSFSKKTGAYTQRSLDL